jgi:membrane associated rhomboid family serine protease
MASLVLEGEIYRLFTAILLHAGALHFIMNISAVIGMLMGF